MSAEAKEIPIVAHWSMPSMNIALDDGICTCRSQAPSIIDLAASSQSPIVLALHADGSLHVWDLSTGQQTSQQKLPLPADSSHLIPARLKCNDASGTASVAVQMDAAGTDGVVQSSQVCVYRLQGADPAVLIGVCDSPVGPLQDVLLQPLQVSTFQLHMISWHAASVI